MKTTTARKRADWLIPLGLVVLSIVPSIGGTMRMAQIVGGAEVTAENARFLTAPVSALLHIAGVVIYSFLGAFQFSPGFRRRHPTWHRYAGRVLVVAGFVVALSGLWMTLTYPWAPNDGLVVYLSRLAVGIAMTIWMWNGYVSARRRDFGRHREWMIRAYAIGLGAGTQVLTHIPWFLLPDLQGETLRAICMTSAWAINVAVAEWLIRRARRPAMPVARREARVRVMADVA